jgi:Holliday junction resolvase-like predicted endonuclease
MDVIKTTGDKEPFSEEKVLESIRRAGVPESLQQKALSHVKSVLKDNITTYEIYHHITEFLSHSEVPYTTGKYSLKQALMQLGPSGYPFEDYVSKLLEKKGYTTQVRQLLKGHCVTHEIDVVAEKDGKKSAIEAKFHNDLGNRSDLHVALYTQARFEDIRDFHKIDNTWIITNTKATTDAIAYGECVGMRIISWSYPAQESLRDVIEKEKLYPITALINLSIGQKRQLLDNHIVVCTDLSENLKLLDKLYLTPDQKRKVKEEIEFLCKE